MLPVLTVFVLILLQAQDSVQQSLLLATDSGIKTLSLATSTLTTLCQHPAKAVDFRYKSKEFYFISNSSEQIFYLYHSDYFQSFLDPVPRVTSKTPLLSLAVDYVSYNLYYYAIAGTLLKDTLQSSKPERVTSQVFELQNFALDPYKRHIFYIAQGQLFSITLNQSVVNRHDLSNSGITELLALATDLHTQEVYLVSRWDSQWLLSVKDYDPSAPLSWVYVGEEFQGVRALAVYHGLITWTSPCGEFHCIYSCQRHSCQDNLTTTWITFDVINDVKYYTPLVQTPDIQTACLLCSHGCLQGSAVCVCPEGMQLGDDGVECKEKPPSWKQQIQDFLDGLWDSCDQWFSSTLTATRPYWYTCGGLVLALLLCCVCLLCTVPCTKPVTEDDEDELQLSEMYHPRCLSRQYRRSNLT